MAQKNFKIYDENKTLSLRGSSYAISIGRAHLLHTNCRIVGGGFFDVNVKRFYVLAPISLSLCEEPE